MRVITGTWGVLPVGATVDAGSLGVFQAGTAELKLLLALGTNDRRLSAIGHAEPFVGRRLETLEDLASLGAEVVVCKHDSSHEG